MQSPLSHTSTTSFKPCHKKLKGVLSAPSLILGGALRLFSFFYWGQKIEGKVLKTIGDTGYILYELTDLRQFTDFVVDEKMRIEIYNRFVYLNL